MKVLFCLALVLLTVKPLPRPAHRHWCEQPTYTLRWLNRMIQNAQSWPAYHYGWEVHQARYQGQEVFVLNLCRNCGLQRGFLLYNHRGVLVGQGEGVDSLLLSHLTNVRLVAFNPGRVGKQR